MIIRMTPPPLKICLVHHPHKCMLTSWYFLTQTLCSGWSLVLACLPAWFRSTDETSFYWRYDFRRYHFLPYWFIQDFVLQICPLLETISWHAACFPSSDKCWYLSFFIMMLSQIRHSCQSKFNNLWCNFMFRQIHDLPGDQPYPFHLCHAIRGGSSGAPENISKTWQISLSKSFLSNEKQLQLCD